MWNEIFLESQKGWVHVDVSAGPDSNMKIPKSARFNHPLVYDDPGMAVKLVSAIAVGSDTSSVVTKRYLSGYDGLQRSLDFMEDNMIRTETDIFTQIQAKHYVGFDFSKSQLSKRAVVMDRLEKYDQAEIRSLFPVDPLAGTGKSEFFAYGYHYRVLSGPVPAWLSLPSLFSTYYAMMAMGTNPWRVGVVSVCKTSGRVSEIIFEYAGGNGEIIRKSTTRPHQSIIWSNSVFHGIDEPTQQIDAPVCHKLVLESLDYITEAFPTITDGILTDLKFSTHLYPLAGFVAHQSRKNSTGSGKSLDEDSGPIDRYEIVGTYGRRFASDPTWIDWIGFYGRRLPPN
jgi:hypothetical protein